MHSSHLANRGHTVAHVDERVLNMWGFMCIHRWSNSNVLAKDHVVGFKCMPGTELDVYLDEDGE